MKKLLERNAQLLSEIEELNQKMKTVKPTKPEKVIKEKEIIIKILAPVIEMELSDKYETMPAAFKDAFPKSTLNLIEFIKWFEEVTEEGTVNKYTKSNPQLYIKSLVNGPGQSIQCEICYVSNAKQAESTKHIKTFHEGG